MPYIFSNNAATTLAVAIDAVVTQLTIVDATFFPSPSVDDPCKITLQDVDTGAIEICNCTNKSGNVLTVVRGRESTSAISFPIGAIVHHRLTAENLNNFTQELKNTGVGEGEIGRDVAAGPIANLKTLQAGTNTSIQNGADEVTINSDDTDLGNIPAANQVTITSSTGGDTIISGAVSGTAGVMTGAQVDELASKEPSLGNPTTDGDVLSSTIAGVRSWVPQSGGINEPADDIYGYVREGPTSNQWVRGARMFEGPTEPPEMAIGDFWVETP